MKTIKYLLSAVFILISSIYAQTDNTNFQKLLDSPKSDVFMQGFYWNSTPGGIWWNNLNDLAPLLASAGFSAVWVPPSSKGAGGAFSMGYDPYDHFDFGDYNQKGSIETRFGSRNELENMISTFHQVGMKVYADAVLRHMMGGEREVPYECIPEYNGSPIVSDSAYLIFEYPAGSGRFPKSNSEFYPNLESCFVDPLFVQTDPAFRFGNWLDHHKQSVVDSLIAWGQYLINDLGYDGFRLDAVKNIDPDFMAEWLNGIDGSEYAVAEYWSSVGDIGNWLNEVQNVNSAKVSMFDFPLRYSLRDMCNNTSGGYNMNDLDGAGLVNSGISGYDVATFVENHDVDRIGYDGEIDSGHDPIYSDKDLAYAYTIFSEGRPCVFYKDYFEYGLKDVINNLIWIRMNFLGGTTTKRGGLNAYYIREDSNTDQGSLSTDIYVARRDGFGDQPGGYLVINDNPDQWVDVWVDTEEPIGTVYRDYSGNDVDKAVVGPATPGGKNRVKLWAPARSFSIYVADTTKSYNNPPVIDEIPDTLIYTNALFEVTPSFGDANDDNLLVSLVNEPDWLTVDETGKIYGTPEFGDEGDYIVTFKINDAHGASTSESFTIVVETNYPPKIEQIPDTTIQYAKRFEYQSSASDPDEDSVIFELVQTPSWLNVVAESGLLSGTPAISDTGLHSVILRADDGKGGYDSTWFSITVVESQDTVIETYGKPTIDGQVNVSENDWLDEWQLITDPNDDSAWKPADTLDNEVMGLYATWDSDSLYLGVDYRINDEYNSLILYIDGGIDGGVDDFNPNNGYGGDYARNFTFNVGIDFFLAAYYLNTPILYKSAESTSVNLGDLINAKRGANAEDFETAIAWNDLYELGPGLIPSNVVLQFVAVVAGGFNWGAGDSAPDNTDVDGDKGPDDLTNLVSISPDQNGDGIPDPTIFITEVGEDIENELPTTFKLSQNYPNPFNPSTVISFSLPKQSKVTVKIYDILGREIIELVENKIYSAGIHNVKFDAGNLSSGIYFYRIQADSFTDVKKMLLVK